MSLTTEQRTDMQGDLGISNDAAVFTDAELDRLYARADENYAQAVYLGYRQLLAQANKFHDYTVGMTRVQRQQMRDNIKDSMAHWQNEARVAGNQLRIVGARGVPPRHKDRPVTTGRRDLPHKDWDGWR